LTRLDHECAQWADAPSLVILQAGSGWGALELARREREGKLADAPSALIFPRATLGREQAKWLHLLEQGRLPDQDPMELPGEWMVQPEWRVLLAASLTKVENRNWFALLHHGVMLAEALDDPGAWEAWQASVRERPSAWAFRNLAVLAGRMNRGTEALSLYDRAWKMAADSRRPDASLAQEYLQTLCAAGRFDRAGEAYSSLPPQAQEFDRIQILRGRIALQLDDLDTVEQVLGREYAVVREGETELTDLWFELWARRVSAQTGRPLDAALRQQVQRTYPPPACIDFRSIN
jgi:tetratricopeptide (TPR) repeat protein